MFLLTLTQEQNEEEQQQIIQKHSLQIVFNI